jgi:excinuclease UvrABC ATPase subunit
MLQSATVTAGYLNGTRNIEIPVKTRKGNGNFLQLKGATGHNLKNVDIQIPLGTFTYITGVSGSGKSSLINQTLFPILMNHFYDPIRSALPFKHIKVWNTSIKSSRLTKAQLAAHLVLTPLLTPKYLTKLGVCLPACQKH